MHRKVPERINEFMIFILTFPTQNPPKKTYRRKIEEVILF
jgi:hypothetical protein